MKFTFLFIIVSALLATSCSNLPDLQMEGAGSDQSHTDKVNLSAIVEANKTSGFDFDGFVVLADICADKSLSVDSEDEAVSTELKEMIE